ncbi:hypothetical protein ACOSQ3_029328 [Xanthoceras sorbifolium]
MPVVGVCPACCLYEEYVTHALWGCKSLSSICAFRSFMNDYLFSKSMNFLDFILSVNHQLGSSDFLVLVIILWRIWFRRNQIVHRKVVLQAEEVIGWAYSFLNEYHVANDSAITVTTGAANLPSPGWSPPPIDCYKLNVDASVSTLSGTVGLAVVLRNEKGLVMWLAACKIWGLLRFNVLRLKL